MQPCPPPSSANTLDRAKWWPVLWVVIGMLHLCPAIWITGGDGIPGDLGDSRFNLLVLEHGYQSFVRGTYDWPSPGQFYPATETLGWSDTHLGTLPLFAIPRLLGLSPERALQFWFLVVAALNLLSAQQLLREGGVGNGWAAPLGVTAFAGAPWVWLAGTHLQLLPVFPGIWTAIFLIRFGRSHQVGFLCLAMGAWLGQFAAGPYLAFFTGSILAAVVGGMLLGARTIEPTQSSLSARPHINGPTWVVVGLGALMGLGNIWIYTHTLQSGFERPMQEVINLTPSWSSWFSASPAHAWWPTGWPGGSAEHSEHVLFGGFLPWLAGLGAVIVSWKHRRKSFAARLAISCVTVAAAIVAVTVRWAGEASLWIWLCEHFETLRAFRAIGRIHILVHSLLVVAFALSLGMRGWQRLPRTVAVVAAWLLILESGASFQPSYSIAEAHARRSALVDAWQEAGDRDILAFAPGFTNQPDSYLQLDAWAAALATQRHTLNGYSGGAPVHHMPFIWNPTRDQAEALMRFHELTEENVSIVERYDESTAAELGFKYQGQRSLRRLEGFDLQPAYWELFTPIEEFRIEGKFFYQFTPPAKVRFHLPDTANRVRYITAMRDGAYTGTGKSDGYDLSITVANASGELLTISEVVNPRVDEMARGQLTRELVLPPGQSRTLTFEFGPGPSGLAPWDWPLLSQLKVE